MSSERGCPSIIPGEEEGNSFLQGGSPAGCPGSGNDFRGNMDILEGAESRMPPASFKCEFKPSGIVMLNEEALVEKILGKYSGAIVDGVLFDMMGDSGVEFLEENPTVRDVAQAKTRTTLIAMLEEIRKTFLPVAYKPNIEIKEAGNGAQKTAV